ncbi:MAG: flippase-like domain-containing protein [candidate division Zixibacteria bacterium]|nr:flippase-like domain-containing protein [candidate division Zixibacteria bacterium]
MTTFWKKKQFWGALIGLILLVYCAKDLRYSDIDDLLKQVDILYIGFALISGFAFMAFKGLRWRLMISHQKKVPVKKSVTLYSVGQLLSITMPALTGQVGRVVLFSRKEKLRKTVVFSTIVLEVLFDAISLIVFMLFTSLAFAFPEKYRYLSFVVAGITLVGMIILYLTLQYQVRLEDFARRRFRDRWPGLYIVCRKFIRSFVKGIEMLRSSQHMFGTLFLSLAAWTSHMMVVWFLIMAFGFQVPFATAAVVMVINTIALMVPITPGNAGTFEIAVSRSLGAFPEVGQSDAVLFALTLHIMDLLPVLIYSYLFLQIEKTTLREIKAVHEKDIILDHIDEDGSFIEKERV